MCRTIRRFRVAFMWRFPCRPRWIAAAAIPALESAVPYGESRVHSGPSRWKNAIAVCQQAFSRAAQSIRLLVDR